MVGIYLNTNSQQSKAVISVGGGEAAAVDVLLPKTAAQENLTSQNFFDLNNLLGSNSRSL